MSLSGRRKNEIGTKEVQKENQVGKAIRVLGIRVLKENGKNVAKENGEMGRTRLKENLFG